MLSEEYVVEHLHSHSFSIFQYRQVCNFINSLLKQYAIVCPLKEFELWIVDLEKQKRTLFNLYKLLSSSQSANDPVRSKWELELKIAIPKPLWGKNCFFN